MKLCIYSHKVSLFQLGAKEDDIDIVLLQETLCKDTDQIKIKGYTVHAKPHNPDLHQRGLAIVINNKIRSEQ